MAIYIIDEELTLHDVESLLIAVSKPEGNKNRGRLKGDLKKDLKDFMKAAAIEEINASLYPNLELKQTKEKITELQQRRLKRLSKITGWQRQRMFWVFRRDASATFEAKSDCDNGLLLLEREKSSCLQSKQQETGDIQRLEGAVVGSAQTHRTSAIRF